MSLIYSSIVVFELSKANCTHHNLSLTTVWTLLRMDVVCKNVLSVRKGVFFVTVVHRDIISVVLTVT